MAILKTATVIGLAAALALTLGACREDERGRRLTYEPGVYKGKPDTPLSEQARRSLKTRILRQRLAGGLSGGGGAPERAPPDVRPPSGAVGGGSAIPLDALRLRARRQGFN